MTGEDMTKTMLPVTTKNIKHRHIKHKKYAIQGFHFHPDKAYFDHDTDDGFDFAGIQLFELYAAFTVLCI